MACHHRPEQTLHQESGSPPGRRRPMDTAGRYIALRYTLTATYHASWEDAEKALVELPAARRAGIVDSLTGKTLASQAAYPEVEEAVSREVLGIMRREGPLGDLALDHRRCLSSSSHDRKVGGP